MLQLYSHTHSAKHGHLVEQKMPVWRISQKMMVNLLSLVQFECIMCAYLWPTNEYAFDVLLQ